MSNYSLNFKTWLGSNKGHPDYRLRRLWYGLLLLVLLGLVVLFSSTYYQKWAYPLHYKDEIWQSAARFGVDPYLVAAVIQAESKYREDSLSSRGAVGLMQIMPETGKWALQQLGYSPTAVEQLHHPLLNIEVGTWYLSWLMRYYQGNVVKSIAAYNAGQGTVDSWLKSGMWDGTADTLNQIPYAETRKYTKRVLYYHKKYQQIYAEK